MATESIAIMIHFKERFNSLSENSCDCDLPFPGVRTAERYKNILAPSLNLTN